MQKESNRPWVVMKFGGTSVSSVTCWKTICDLARANIEAGEQVLIVVSALSNVTNLLTRLAEGAAADEQEAILGELETRHRALMEGLGQSPSERFNTHWESLLRLAGELGSRPAPGQRALLLAHGELLSSSIGSEALSLAGLNPCWQDARTLLEVTPESINQVLAARCGDHSDPGLAGRLAGEGALHITQGFIASKPGAGKRDMETCLLGRGGSDTSAAYLAARLAASRLEIWTDVPGIFSADPRVVPEARLLRHLGYSEAQELASMGAKVLHPPSIQPAMRHGIPVYIKDTHRPAEPGTRIGAHPVQEDAQVKGIVSRENITLISMENPAMWHQVGFLADAFAIFKEHGYSVDLISTSESTVTVSLDPQVPAHFDESRMAAFLQDLERLCGVRVHRGCMTISLVGNSIRTILGRLSAALDVFQDRHVHMVTQSANDLNLTLVVDPEHALSLVRKLHQLLITSIAENRPEFGPSWKELTRLMDPVEIADPWWDSKAEQLLRLMDSRMIQPMFMILTRRAVRPGRSKASMRSAGFSTQ